MASTESNNITSGTKNVTDPNHSQSIAGSVAAPIKADSGATINNDIIGFKDSGAAFETDYSRVGNLTRLIRDLHPATENSHTISEFLKRPVLIDQRQVTADNTMRGQTIFEFDVMQTFMNSQQFQHAREKLNGFYGFSAKANYRVTINAQPFISGIFMLCFAPTYRNAKTSTYYPIVAGNANTIHRLPFMTGLPMRILNVSKTSAATLSVDYVAPNVYMNFGESTKNNPPDYGQFFLVGLSPVAAATSGAYVSVNSYLYFTEVKTFGAARPLFTAQGPELTSEQAEAQPTVEKKEPEPWYSKFKPSNIMKIGSLIPGIELLPYGNYIKAGLNLGSYAARTAGFSKPVSQPNFQRMTITPFGQPQNVDGSSNAFKLGSCSENFVGPQQYGITEHDEMNINNIVQTPTYYASFQVNTSGKPGRLVWQTPVEPNCMQFEGDLAEWAYPTLLYYVANHFRYWRGGLDYTFHVASTQFHTMRLRFVYEIDASAVQTISERDKAYVFSQVVDITKGMSFTIHCPYFATTPWRDVPLILARFESSQDYFVSDYKYGQPNNTSWLRVFVESDLSTLDSAAANTVDFVVMASAAKDFQCAAPVISQMAPINQQGYINSSYETTGTEDWTKPPTLMSPPFNTNNFTPKSGPSLDNPTQQLYPELPLPIGETLTEKERKKLLKSMKKRGKLDCFSPQGPEHDASEEDDIPTINMCNGLNTDEEISPMASVVTMGEVITSLRQLIKRYSLVGYDVQPEGLPDRYARVICPFFQPYSGPQGAGTAQKNTYASAWLYRFQPLFRYYRGGMRFMIVSNSVSESQPITSVIYNPAMEYLPHFTTFDLVGHYGSQCPIAPVYDQATGTKPLTWMQIFNQWATTSAVPFVNKLQGGVEIQFPYYSKYPFLRVEDHRPGAEVQDYYAKIAQAEVPAGTALISVTGAKGTTTEYYSAAADDYSLCYRLGAPICRTRVKYNNAGADE